MASRIGTYAHWQRWIFLTLALLAGLACVAAAIGLAGRWVEAITREETDRAASTRMMANAGLIGSELQKFRLLPLVLADHPDVDGALRGGRQPTIDKLNHVLEMLADRTDAAVIYLIDRQGMTIAASNWRRPDSFVGQRYGFRPYFTRALHAGGAEQFALGTVSRRPGLFLARRTAHGDGVIVVKVEFDRIERDWIKQAGPTFVRDANGVITISSRTAWRLHATAPLPAALRKELSYTRQYGDALPPMIALAPGDSIFVDKTSGERSLVKTVPVPVPGWTLSVLEPMAPAQKSAEAQARFIALAAGLLILVAAGLVFRIREKRQLATAAQRALEAEVRSRTAELRNANEQLVLEHAERERNEVRLRSARDELAQANRLGTLGQITAGVAHEINQPVTAIGAFAENAIVMSDRGNAGGARENLGRIVELTKRIGQITAELRLFARRDNPRGPVLLGDAIEGALLLMGDRLRTIRVVREGDFARISVMADRVRLEQVIINLMQNAADALEGHDEGIVTLSAVERAKTIDLVLGDNGPGVAPDKRDHLFTPFVTTKEKGLGLGLAIARDIVRDFGGELSQKVAAGGGAAFVIRLRKI